MIIRRSLPLSSITDEPKTKTIARDRQLCRHTLMILEKDRRVNYAGSQAFRQTSRPSRSGLCEQAHCSINHEKRKTHKTEKNRFKRRFAPTNISMNLCWTGWFFKKGLKKKGVNHTSVPPFSSARLIIVFRKSSPSCISLGDAGTLSTLPFAPYNRERRHVCIGVNAASIQLGPAALIVGVWNPPSVSMGDCNVVSEGDAGALPAPHTTPLPFIFRRNE